VRIAYHISNKKARFISLHFASAMLCLIACALNGNLNVQHGYVFIRNLGALKLTENIMSVSQARLSGGSMLAMVLASCGVTIVHRSSLKRWAISMANG